MLPVIISEPVKFNLTNNLGPGGCGSDGPNSTKRPSSQLSNSSSVGIDEFGDKQRDSITLYPITVEFDRLLRRQQQLKQYSSSNGYNHLSTINSTLNSPKRPSHTTSSPKSTPTKSTNFKRTSSISSNASSALFDDSPGGPAGFIQNLDAHSLLYSTILHYYASLNPKSFSTSSPTSCSCRNCHEQSQQTNNQSGTTATTEQRIQNQKDSPTSRKVITSNDSESMSHKQCTQQQQQTEVDSLDAIYKTLCTPGTRTMLLVADKNEIINNFLQHNPASELMSEILLNSDVEIGFGCDEVLQVDPNNNHKTTILNGTNNDHNNDADVESDLETEYSKPKPNSKPVLTKSSHTQVDRHHDFCGCSSGINSSMSEDCLTSSLRADEVEMGANSLSGPSSLQKEFTRKLSTDQQAMSPLRSLQSSRNSRSYRICKLMMQLGSNGAVDLSKSSPAGLYVGQMGGNCAKMRAERKSSISKNRFIYETRSQTTTKKSSKKYLADLDRFLESALKRQQEFYRIIYRNLWENSRKYEKPSTSSQQVAEKYYQPKLSLIQSLSDCLGLEQQIVGCVTFYKSYRLTGIKVIELALISVLSNYRQSGIGSYLLECVKENGQIGPYDAIRVKLPYGPEVSSNLKKFFMQNEFSDDLILNASFDQLDGVASDGDEEQEVDSRGNYEDGHEDRMEGMGNSSSYHLHHSISFDGSPTSRSSRYRSQRSSKRSQTPQSPSSTSISLCYLPPFTVATALTSGSRKLNTRTPLNQYVSPSSRTLLSSLDNRYVDDLIEEANGVWKRDILSAYRTQWSCVARLRAEIYRLRALVGDSETIIQRLKRDNHQLRTKLLQNETTAQLNAQKHLFLLKNFNFDSLDF